MNYTYLESATTTKKTTNQQTNKPKRTEQNRFTGQRSYAYHTHIPTTNTHTHTHASEA